MKSRLHIIVLPILAIIFVLTTSCSEEDILKNPATVSFDFNMNSDGVNAPPNLMFDSACVVLSSFTVIGDRTSAEGFEFTRTFPAGLILDLKQMNNHKVLQYDLPQGQYRKITLRFETTQLYFQGKYTYTNAPKNPSLVRFTLNTPKQFEVQITDTLGNTALTLHEFSAEYPKIMFRPRSWFDGITGTMLENAAVFFTWNQQVMDINKDNNALVFNLVEQKIASNTKCFLHP